MSLFGVLNTVTGSLTSATQQIGVVAQNINNSQNTNYSDQTASLVDIAPALGGGAEILNVTRAVNTSLQSAYLSQTTSSGRQTQLNQVYQQLENLTGAATGAPVLSGAMQTLTSALTDFQTSPESTTAQNAVLTASTGLASTVSTLASGVNALTTQAVTQTNSDVTALNNSLTSISSFNKQIVALQAIGGNTNALQDSRDAAIATVAALVPVRTIGNADGSVNLLTPDGVSLVGAQASQFTYNSTTNSISTVGDPNATTLNNSFSNGKISADLDVLSTNTASTNPLVAPLARLSQQLNSFVDQFYAPQPPATVAPAVPPNQTQPTPFQFASYITPTNSTTTTATTTAGSTTITVPATATGLAVGDTVEIPGAGANGTPLITTIASLSLPSATLTDTPASSVTNAAMTAITPATNSGSTSPGDPTVSLSPIAPASTITPMPVGSSVSIPGAGPNGATLVTTVTSVSGTNITLATAPSTAVSATVSSLGTDLFYIAPSTNNADDRFNFQVNPNLLNSTASLNQGGAQAMLAAVTATNNSFSSAGVSVQNASLGNIADAIASTQSQNASAVQTANQDASTSLTASTTAYKNATGVSVDTELTKLIVFQNSYNASAKLIGTVSQLFTTLLGSFQ